MVEIECPACGAPGRITKEKTLTRLICRKCLKVFHVTPSGRSVLGEPPGTSQTASAPATAKAAADPTEKLERLFDRASTGLVMPESRTIATGLIVVVLAAALYYLYNYWRPDTLENRVTQAARAAVQGDRRTIQELAAAGHGDAVDDWYLSIRTKCDELLQRLGSAKPSVETRITLEDPGHQWADVVAVVSTDEGLERKGNALPDTAIVANSTSESISLPMAWKVDGIAGWRLDGGRTRELNKVLPTPP
jgi:hypothetical protein